MEGRGEKKPHFHEEPVIPSAGEDGEEALGKVPGQ